MIAEMAINTYKILHAIGKTHDGGLSGDFFKLRYQLKFLGFYP